jgi:peptide deformylase
VLRLVLLHKEAEQRRNYAEDNKEVAEWLVYMEIMTYPRRVLRKKAYPVYDVGEAERLIFDEMITVMKQNNGIGLAAPQVGIPSRLIVADLGEGIIKLANPLITERWGTRTLEEGCLSLPGIRVIVQRSRKITVTGYNEKGEQVALEASGLLATVLQHETDHTNGKLIIDYLPLWQKMRYSLKRYKQLLFKTRGRVAKCCNLPEVSGPGGRIHEVMK